MWVVGNALTKAARKYGCSLPNEGPQYVLNTALGIFREGGTKSRTLHLEAVWRLSSVIFFVRNRVAGSGRIYDVSASGTQQKEARYGYAELLRRNICIGLRLNRDFPAMIANNRTLHRYAVRRGAN